MTIDNFSPRSNVLASELIKEDRDAKVLLIEDSELDLHILLELITDFARVCAAMSGEKALKILEEESYDLILMDIMLPDMSGFDLLERFQNMLSLKETPVIIISALNDPFSEEKGLKLGAVDFVSKPFHPAIIRARVQNQISLSRTTKELRKANEKLALLAAIDPLTELFNRRQFIQLVTEKLEPATFAVEHGCCFLMLDLDYFKQINDNYGHNAGDVTLRTLSKVWADTLRPGDIIGRIGGEEFAVFLADTGFESGQMIAERLRQVTTRTKVSVDQQTISVTCSIGMVHCAQAGTEYAQLYQRADQALYAAKALGRNTVKSIQLTL